MSFVELPILQIQGDPEYCGKRYGELHETAIRGFYNMEIAETGRWLRFAESVYSHIKKLPGPSVKFLKGMSQGARLSLKQAILLTLHEEIVHRPHCTAFVKSRFSGQNWDWEPKLFPWAGILKLRQRGFPRIIAYHYPGLWNCAGVNETGLSLMWTGAGYCPNIPPKKGVPTYLLISEILALESVKAAIKLLRSVKNAGCFIFLLKDGRKRALIEAIPGKIKVLEGSSFSRANHYECFEIAKAARQRIRDKSTFSTLERSQFIARKLPTLKSREAKRVLQTKPLYDYSGSRMTIDSLLAHENQLWVARGGARRGRWKRISWDP